MAWRAASFALLVVAAGCNGLFGVDELSYQAGTSASGSGVGGAASSGASSSASQGSSAGQGGAGGEGGEGGGPMGGQGFVFAFQFEGGGMAGSTAGIVAGFTPAGQATNCTHEVHDSCFITWCPPPTPSTGEVPHAGTISAMGLIDVTLAPEDGGAYDFNTSVVQGPLFGADTDIALQAGGGGGVPGFSTGVSSPEAAQLSLPIIDQNGVTAPDSGGWAFVWDQGSGTELVIQAALTREGMVGNLYCEYPHATQAAAISNGALDALSGATGTMSLTTQSSTLVDAGAWEVRVGAFVRAKQGQAVLQGIPVTFP